MTRLWQLLLALGLLGACAAPETLVEPGDTRVFAAAATFAIVAPDPRQTADRSAEERLQAAVEGEIMQSLSAKGYQHAPLDGAELRVAYRLASMGRVARDDRQNPQAESRPRMGQGDPYGDYHPLAGTGDGERRGLLLITITDARSGAVVWQATSEGAATSTASAVGAVARGAHAALANIPAALHKGQ